MQRAFLKNLFWLQALNWLIKPIWILWIERTVQVQLGNEWYGQYFVHFNLGLLFAVLLDAGLNAYVSREVAANGRLTNLTRIIGLRLALGVVYIAAVGWVANNQNLDWRILAFVICNQVLASILLFTRAILQGKQRFIQDSVVSVTDRLVAIVASAWFLYGGSTFSGLNGIVVFLMAQTMGYAIALVLSAVFVARSKMADRQDQNNKISHHESWVKWSKEVVWYILMALFMSAFTRIDALMIRNLSPDMFGHIGIESGYYQAGIYAQSYRLLDAGLIFSTLLSTQLLPVFSKNIAEKLNSSDLIWLAFRLVWFVGIMAVAVSFIWGEHILNILYGEKWLDEINSNSTLSLSTFSWMNFTMLMVAFMAMTCIHVFGTYITALGKLRWLSVMALLALLVNVLLNRSLIPQYGSFGAALSAGLTQWLFAIMCFIKAIRHETISWKGIKWKTAPMSLFLMLLVVLFWSNVQEPLKMTSLAFASLTIIVLGVTWMLFGKDVKHILGQKK